MYGSSCGFDFPPTDDEDEGSKSVFEYVPDSVMDSGSTTCDDLSSSSTEEADPVVADVDPSTPSAPGEDPAISTAVPIDPSRSTVTAACLPTSTLSEDDQRLFEKVRGFVEIILAERNAQNNRVIDLNLPPAD